MTIEYTIDFTPFLPQKQAPKLNEVQTWLNCNISDIGRGNIIIQNKPGVFILKVHDDAKGQSLENRKVKYFLPGDTEGKKPVIITITRREWRKKWVNPKYVSIWGVYKAELDEVLTNKQLTKHLEMYGTILEPVEDVLDLSDDSSWALDKKKCRIDLDKGDHIPRNLHLEIPSDDGIVKGTLRITYKDQPWYCRRCVLDHDGECPKRMNDRKREDEIREQKARDTKTLIIGDSNLKLVNSKAILADVVASSGAKLGHICNQLQHESLDKYQNIVVFAGINNVPGPNDRMDEGSVSKQVDKEIKSLEKELAKQVIKGKNIFLTQVANPTHARNTPKNVKIRNKINKELHDLKTRLKAKNKKVNVDTINWNVFHDDEDYNTVKAISEKAIISFIGKVDEKIEGGIRAKYLDTILTADPYSSVRPTYPMGCYKCTEVDHSEDFCTSDLNKKRNRSEETEGQGPPPKSTSFEHAS